MEKSITVSDIAEALGISKTTVSRAISGNGRIGNETKARVMQYIKDYCAREAVDVFVVGEAKHMDGTPSESMQYIEPFVEELKRTFPDKEVARVDERFTSKIAFQTMIDSGLRKKQRRDKGMIDQIAATIILQSYMSTINNRPI